MSLVLVSVCTLICFKGTDLWNKKSNACNWNMMRRASFLKNRSEPVCLCVIPYLRDHLCEGEQSLDECYPTTERGATKKIWMSCRHSIFSYDYLLLGRSNISIMNINVEVRRRSTMFAPSWLGFIFLESPVAVPSK